METQQRPVPPGVIKLVGLLVGGAAGPGIALGGGYQPTTANIHSGHAWRGVRGLFLLVAGGVLGAGAGFILGWLALHERPTIDCDESSYCAGNPDSFTFP